MIELSGEDGTLRSSGNGKVLNLIPNVPGRLTRRFIELKEAQSKSSVAISTDHHGADAIHAINDVFFSESYLVLRGRPRISLHISSNFRSTYS